MTLRPATTPSEAQASGACSWLAAQAESPKPLTRSGNWQRLPLWHKPQEQALGMQRKQRSLWISLTPGSTDTRLWVPVTGSANKRPLAHNAFNP